MLALARFEGEPKSGTIYAYLFPRPQQSGFAPEPLSLAEYPL